MVFEGAGTVRSRRRARQPAYARLLFLACGPVNLPAPLVPGEVNRPPPPPECRALLVGLARWEQNAPLRTQLGVGRSGTDPGGDASEVIAFGHLFRGHAQAVYAFCARRTGDLSVAEDLTSITFLEAWRHRNRMPAPDFGSALPWLLGVATNVVRNARRAQRRYHSFLERLPAPLVVAPAEDHAVARLATEAGLKDALGAISGLPEREQEVVMLVLWSGLSYDEAAAALDIPVGTVQSRLSRARTKLQITLADTAHAILKESS